MKAIEFESPYLVAGDPNNRPLILVHGAGVSRTLWHPQIDALAEHYQVFALDLPGHGAMAEVTFGLDAAVQSITDLIEKENIQSPIIAGISLGGYIAMLHAKHHPELSAGLVLSGSSMNLTGIAGLSYLGVALMIKFKGVDWIEENSRKSLHKIIPEDALPGLLEGGLYYRDTSKIFAQLAMKNYHKMLKEYPHPVLILNGADDVPNRAGEEKLLAVLTTGKVKVIEEAGHLVNLEKADDFNSSVIQFGMNGTGA